MANTWNESGTTWGQNSWGSQGPLEITLTGQSATSSLGSIGLTFGASTEPITGQQATTGLGSLTLNIVTPVSITGLQAQSELGTFDNAGTLVGWGRNGWGEEPYGDSFNSLVQLAGLSATSRVGSVTTFDTVTVIPTGVSSISAVGSLGFIISPVVVPTGQSATSNVGDFDPAAETVGLTGQSTTSAVGSITPADVMGLTGRQINSQVGNLIEKTATFVTPTGVSATSSVGSLVSEIGVTLSGVSATSAVGAIAPTSMTVGLNGQQTVSSVGEVIILGFQDVNIVGNTNYSDVDVVGETSYTDVTHVA